jgi:acyl-CoA synthetase (AMP-forming)/AMP-acid ligase II
METTILHSRIRNNKAKYTNPVYRQLLAEYENWLYAIENYIADIEQDNFTQAQMIHQQEEMIEFLVKILCIYQMGEVMVSLRTMDEQKVKRAIDFLFKNKEYQNLYVTATLLELAEADGNKIETVAQLADYARTGKISA